MKKIVIGISGASGVLYGVRLLEVLSDYAETHLVITESAIKVMQIETGISLTSVQHMAHVWYNNDDCSAAIASGSFLCDAMAILPCSIKSLSAISQSMADNLLVRAADVARKERRTLILGVREMPFHSGHLKLMCRLANDGVIICPPIPSFYQRTTNDQQVLDSVVAKYLDLLGIEHSLSHRWHGLQHI
jgi:4-hydroxy-3-polyprenylbenzoate decarboxylase